MIKIILISLCSMLLLLSCVSIQTLSTPPTKYKPNRPTDDKSLIQEWQYSLMKIKEWEVWANINRLEDYNSE